ncbi:MAG: hypothetical protein H0W50_11050 [Parachlamydiaceae bacterium]|nr:hypothetical protein [Parachlamydiaceae bacterium]
MLNVYAHERTAAVDTASIVRVANLNQDAELKMQKLMATFGRLKETIHQQIRSWQCDYQISPKTIKQYAKQIDSLIVDKVKDAPWEQFGIYQEDVEVAVFFTNIINQMCEKFNPLLEIFFPFNPFFAKASFKQNLMQCVNFNILPKKISAAALSGPEQLVEQQSISHVQHEQTSLVQREQLRDASENSDSGQLLYWNWKRDTGYSTAFFENSFTRQQFLDVILKSPKGFLAYVSQNQVPFLQLDSFLDSNLSNLVNIFDIEVSYNFHPFLGLRLKGSDSTVGEISLFEKGQIDVQNMLLCTNRKTGKRQLRLISRADAGFFFDQLSVEKEPNRQLESDKENENEIEITLYNLSLGVIQSNNKHIQSGFKTPVNSIFLQKIVQAKFFNGESFYTPMEFTALQKWIKEKGAAKMEKLFVNHILENKKLKARSFYGSPLDLFFKACHDLIAPI